MFEGIFKGTVKGTVKDMIKELLKDMLEGNLLGEPERWWLGEPPGAISFALSLRNSVRTLSLVRYSIQNHS